MASIKVKFRPHSAQKEGSLYYQVIHRRLTRQISTVFRIKSSEWNGYDIVIPPDCGEARYAYLNSIKNGVRHDITRLSSIVKRYNASGEVYSTEDIVSSFHDPGTIIGFMSFAQNLIEKMKQIGKDKMAKRFSATISSLAKYTEHEDIPWQEFNSTLILGYEEFLLERGLCRNSTSYYMRNLRSIANKAAEHGFSLCPNPFKHVYMGVDKTVKRAISLKTICRIRDIDLSESPFLDFARNVFVCRHCIPEKERFTKWNDKVSQTQNPPADTSKGGSSDQKNDGEHGRMHVDISATYNNRRYRKHRAAISERIPQSESEFKENRRINRS